MADDSHLRVPQVRGRSRAAIHSYAHEFVELVQPSALVRPEKFDVIEGLEGIWDALGIRYHVVESLGANTEGETLPGGIIVIPSQIFSGPVIGNPRDRVTITHECGHALMHAEELEAASKRQSGVALYRRNELPAYLDPEWQAFEFAGYALAPTGPALSVMDGHAEYTWADRISEAFGMSMLAAESRIRSLRKYCGIPS